MTSRHRVTLVKHSESKIRNSEESVFRGSNMEADSVGERQTSKAQYREKPDHLGPLSARTKRSPTEGVH